MADADRPAVRCGAAGGVVGAGGGRRGAGGGGGRAGGGEGAGGAGRAGEGPPPFLLFSAFRDLGKPIIARVAGHALGGGLGLAVSCDLAIAADDVKLGTPEINVGLWPMMIMAVLNPNTGPRQAFNLYVHREPAHAAQPASVRPRHRAVKACDPARHAPRLPCSVIWEPPQPHIITRHVRGARSGNGRAAPIRQRRGSRASWHL